MVVGGQARVVSPQHVADGAVERCGLEDEGVAADEDVVDAPVVGGSPERVPRRRASRCRGLRYDPSVPQHVGELAVGVGVRRRVEVAHDHERIVARKLRRASCDDRGALSPRHHPDVVEVRVHDRQRPRGRPVAERRPGRDARDGGVPAHAAGHFGRRREPEGAAVLEVVAVGPVQDRALLTAAVGVAPDAEPREVREPLVEDGDHLGRRLLDANDIGLEDGRDHGLDAVRPRVLVVRLDIEPDVERHHACAHGLIARRRRAAGRERQGAEEQECAAIHR